MRWQANKLRFSIDELAIHFGISYHAMRYKLKKAKVDMRRASDVLKFISDLTHQQGMIRIEAELHGITEN